MGKALTHHALEEAKKYGALTVDLTSRPSREAANKLYQSVGFQKERPMYTVLKVINLKASFLTCHRHIEMVTHFAFLYIQTFASEEKDQPDLFLVWMLGD